MYVFVYSRSVIADVNFSEPTKRKHTNRPFKTHSGLRSSSALRFRLEFHSPLVLMYIS